MDCYYVDKTDHVRRLVEGGKHYFLSRPCRFKSLVGLNFRPPDVGLGLFSLNLAPWSRFAFPRDSAPHCLGAALTVSLAKRNAGCRQREGIIGRRTD